MNMDNQPGSRNLVQGDSLPPWIESYLGGIVDNHFNLVISITSDSNRKVGYKIQHSIRYKAEGQGIIHLLRQYCDSIQVEPRIQHKEDKKYPHYEFVISKRRDIEAFLKPIQPYIINRENAVSLLLQRIIPGLDEGMHGSKESFLDLMEDVDEFRDEAGRANRAKYDYQYFVEVWEE